MGKYVVEYEKWDKEKLKELGILLNDLMTCVGNTCANDNEEQSWLRQFEKDLDGLINKKC